MDIEPIPDQGGGRGGVVSGRSGSFRVDRVLTPEAVGRGQQSPVNYKAVTWEGATGVTEMCKKLDYRALNFGIVEITKTDAAPNERNGRTTDG
jgi:hypothetical protein